MIQATMKNSSSYINVSKTDLAFFRRIATVGAFLLFGISAMNMFMETEMIDRPLFRTILAALLLLLSIASYFSDFIRKNGLNILYVLTILYIVSAVFISALNHFDVYDTSTTIIVCFALGALFKSKHYLTIYLVAVFISFVYFLNSCDSPKCNISFVYGTLTLMMVLAYIIFVGKIKAVEELTKNKMELEASEARFRNIFDYSPLGILLLDRFGKPMKANKTVQEMLGYNEQSIINMSLSNYINSQDLMDYETLYHKLKESPNNSFIIEQRLITKNGETIWGCQTMALMEGETEEESFIICMIKDNTFEKEASVKLEEYANKLETHNKSLEEFSYVISHDLQEPLRMIKSYSTIIQRKYISKINDDNANLDMSYVIDGATRMSNLIKDMLAYSRWSAKPFEKEKVDSLEVLVEVLKNLTISIKDNEAVIIANDLPEVTTNRLLLGQVFQNLLGNGIKYSYKDRKPIIEIKGERRDFDVKFTIKDNGQGFSEKDKDRIFGIFQRLHGRHSEYTGTGIGLAICKRVIEKQGGTIWANGVEGEGAEFYFTLPIEMKN